MVRPSARRGDDDLGPVTEGQVELKVILLQLHPEVHWGFLPNHYIYQLGLVLLFHRTAHTLREDDQRVHDDNDDDDDDDDDSDGAGDEEEPVPVALAAPASSSDNRPRLGKGKGLTDSFMSMMSKISGSCNKRPNKARDVLAPTQRKKAKSSNWELRELVDGGPVDLVLIPSYGGYVAGWTLSDPKVVELVAGTGHTFCSLVCSNTPTQHYYRLLWRGGSQTPTISTCSRAVDLHYSRDQLIVIIQSNLGILYTGGGTNGQELFDVATDPRSRLSSSDRAACYIQYLLDSSLFTYKIDNIVPTKLWPLVRDVRSYGGFAWGVDACLLVHEPWSGLAC
ncbi:hypothetical protein M9H77_27375 [Catharanthus roseus]|uniref:Uncharacterized protein n=1 Tax=Catharanthus roseus TaxID=4058 RepID=A0ACC0ADT0_CATRO|nr:hypothetical protein M9H77_27375 [Catharanthus roseus]